MVWSLIFNFSYFADLRGQKSTKSGKSGIIDEYKRITDARLKNKLTGKEIRIRANSTPLVSEILRKFDLLT